MRVQKLTMIRSEMNEVEVINIFKWYSDKKTEWVIKFNSGFI